jgi:hypothetical protein
LKNAVLWDVACVDLVRTDVSEEREASIFRVEKIHEPGTTLAIVSSRILSSLNMKATRSSEMSALTKPHGGTSPKTVTAVETTDPINLP